MKSAQKTSPTFSNFGTGLKNAGAGVAAAAKLAGAGLPSLWFAALGAAAFSASVQRGDSAVMLAPGTIAPGQAYIDAAIPFANYMVAVAITNPDSGEIISYGSGLRMNGGILTAAHVVDNLGGNVITVLGGSNNFYSPEYASTASSVITHSDFMSATGTAGTTLDLAFLTTATLPGSSLAFTPQAIAAGQIMTGVGFGRPQIGTFGPLLPRDGYLRAFDGRVVFPSSINTNLFGQISGTGFSSNIPGLASPGDSGGIGFVDGVPSGIFFSSSGTRSSFTRFDSPEFLAYVNFVPEPSTVSSGALSLMLLFKRKRVSEN